MYEKIQATLIFFKVILFSTIDDESNSRNTIDDESKTDLTMSVLNQIDF